MSSKWPKICSFFARRITLRWHAWPLMSRCDQIKFKSNTKSIKSSINPELSYRSVKGKLKLNCCLIDAKLKKQNWISHRLRNEHCWLNYLLLINFQYGTYNQILLQNIFWINTNNYVVSERQQFRGPINLTLFSKTLYTQFKLLSILKYVRYWKITLQSLNLTIKDGWKKGNLPGMFEKITLYVFLNVVLIDFSYYTTIHVLKKIVTSSCRLRLVQQENNVK